jgi:tRNA A-37 threonylcarbamoyl transferase component Bud32
MDILPYVLADGDYYLPPERRPDLGTMFHAHGVPDDWQVEDAAVWRRCFPPGGLTATHGWKVHVSARLDRPQHVLDTAAARCVELGVAFKHLRSSFFFLLVHHKHGFRPQGGKFLAAYPADEATARRLLDALAADLAGEPGPYILSDRRYRHSGSVAYRYGGFHKLTRPRPDGSPEYLVPDGSGALVPDRREVAWRLPDDVRDPFDGSAGGSVPGEPEPDLDVADEGGLGFADLEFLRAARHSNGGGTYKARIRATGEEVFVKEARRHIGLQWDGSTAQHRLAHEYRILRRLNDLLPGVAPRPYAFFRHWEHVFLVAELVPGSSLQSWAATHQPAFRSGTDAEQLRDYHLRCMRVLAQLREQLAALHAVDHVFVDVSPSNVLIDAHDTVRLIDFETAGEIGGPRFLHGTDGYFPPEQPERLRELARTNAAFFDAYGLAAIARMLTVGPMHHVLEREPAAFGHLRHTLEETGPVPPELWRQTRTPGSRPVPDGPATDLPSPQEVAADPLPHLRALRDSTARALEAMADPGGTVIFPTVAAGWWTNPHSVGHGTAGVLHALRLSGREPDPAILKRLAADALRSRDDLAPGLRPGTAGIAWVMADHGLLEEAGVLLRAATRHPVLTQRATLAEGTAGVLLTHLALFRHGAGEDHLEQAWRLWAGLPADAGLSALLGPGDATGLHHGLPGIALAGHYLSREIGDEAPRQRGLRLLRAEAARAVAFPGGGLGFPVSGTDVRNFPYLARGSAGFAVAAARYLDDAEDLGPLVTEALVPARIPVTAYSGLEEGRAGLVFAAAEYAALTGDASSKAVAVAGARRLFHHAVSGPHGVRFHGEGLLRFSADLATGSAGVLLALSRLLDDLPDALFTLDAPARPR